MTLRPWPPLALLAAGCGPAVPRNVSAPPPPDPSSLDVRVHYDEGEERSLDLYPVETKGRPLVVFVHGGAWKGGTRKAYGAVAAALQKRGIAAASVDYRLSPRVQHPAHAEDVARAIAWLSANAEKQGYDPKRIFVVGHSAGAHIAATLATDPRLLALAKPAGFVGLEGIYDLPNLAARWPSYPDWFLKGAFGDPKGWPAASPTRAEVASKAPWLLVHSTGDELVDPSQTDDFARHLRDAGVAVERLRPAGKGHDEVVEGLGAPDDEVTKALVAFVEKTR